MITITDLKTNSARGAKGSGVPFMCELNSGFGAFAPSVELNKETQEHEYALAGMPMDSANLLHTHLWSHRNSRQFKQEGKTILLRQCSRCGRDFAKGLDGSERCAVYLGAFKVERLAQAINGRWLKEACPRMHLSDDDVARGHG